MGQKLVTIKFNPGSSPNLWDSNLNVNFLVEVSGSSGWNQQSSYYPNLTTMNNLPVNLGTQGSLTDSVVRNLIKNNRVAAFLVDDSVAKWRVSFKENFLTEGTWEVLTSGSF